MQEGSDEFGDVYCRKKFLIKSVSQNKLSSRVHDGVSQVVYHGVTSYLRSIQTETRQNLICIRKVIYKCILIPVYFFFSLGHQELWWRWDIKMLVVMDKVLLDYHECDKIDINPFWPGVLDPGNPPGGGPEDPQLYLGFSGLLYAP